MELWVCIIHCCSGRNEVQDLNWKRCMVNLDTSKLLLSLDVNVYAEVAAWPG